MIAIYRHLTHDPYFMFSSSFASDDLRSLNLTLGCLLSELSRLNVTHFMTAGTLLGSYRHHGRIPWDGDVDLMLNMSDKKLLYGALTALEPDYGLYLNDDFDSPYSWKFFPLRRGSPVPRRTYRWPFVDLLFFGEDDTGVWQKSLTTGKYRYWPRSVVFPLRRRPFDGFWIPAPCDVPRALAVDYDLSVCVSSSYSSKYNQPMPWWPVAVNCSLLADRYPMVVRRSTVTDTGTRRVEAESLMLGNRTLHTVTLESGC